MKHGYRQTGLGVVAACFFATGLACVAGMPTDYELARWAFNEGSGTNTADLSGHGWTVTLLKDNGAGNVPTVTNTLWTNNTPTGTGNALALNGTDQYATPEPFGGGNTLWTLSTLTNWSMSLWVKVQANGVQRTMLGHGFEPGVSGWNWEHIEYGGPNLFFTARMLKPTTYTDSVLGDGGFNIGAGWHHLVLTWRQDAATTNTIAKYYLDGIDDPLLTTKTSYPSEWTLNGPMPTGTFHGDVWHQLYIGATGRNDTQTRGHFFLGLMDEVRIFGAALTTNEVKKLYLQPEIAGADLWLVEHPPRGTVIAVK